MNTNNIFTNFVSLLTCSSNGVFKNNTLENEALLISDQKIHLTPLITNDQNESLLILDKNKVSINGDCDIKGKILIDSVDLMQYISTSSDEYTNNILIANDNNNLPGYSWSNNPTSGMYQSFPGEIDFAINTEKKVEINKNGVHIIGNKINIEQFEKAIVSSIFIDNENSISIGSNISAKYLYISDENSLIIEDLVKIDDLVINPDESNLLVNSGDDHYYDFSILNCSSNGEYKSNTNANDVILITGNSKQKLHLSTSDTNEQDESLVVLENDNMLINGNCHIKGNLFVNNKSLIEYTENSSNSIINASVYVPIDNVNNPGYSWSNNTDTGMYQSEPGHIDFGVNNERKVTITESGVQIFGNCEIFGKVIENNNYSDFSQLTAAGIHIKTIEIAIFNTRIISSGIFIGYGDVDSTDNIINTNHLYINPSEESTFQPKVIDSYIVTNDNVINPGYSWLNDTDTGMYQSEPGNIDFCVNNENKVAITESGVKIFGNCEIFGKIIENENYNDFSQLIAAGIHIKTIESAIFNTRIISSGIFIGYGDVDSTDNIINTNHLYINPSEESTFQPRVIDSYNVTNDDLNNPGYSWLNDTDTGMYQSKPGYIDFGVNNERKVAITESGVEIFGDCKVFGKITENYNNDNNDFYQLIAEGIHIKSIETTIFNSRIISSGIFIGFGNVYSTDNIINTNYLCINPSEESTFKPNVIDAYNISQGVLSIENGGTGSIIGSGNGIPVFNKNPIFPQNIVVQKSIIASDLNNTIPDGKKTQLTNALDIIDSLTPFLYETENIIKSGLDSNIPTSLEHILSDNGKLINYIQLIPYLIQAVKELKSMIP